MDDCGQFLKAEFPLINDDIYEYVESVLKTGVDDFEDGNEIYEAVGGVLHEVAEDKTEEDIREICERLLFKLRGTKSLATNGIEKTNKILNAPVHLGSIVADRMEDVEDIKSIWVIQRDECLKVDARKLEKAEQKLQQKQGKRMEFAISNKIAPPIKLQTATASQVTNRKVNKLEAKGINRVQDIKIENFDISFGDKVLLQGADLVLAHGRRYGLVGRNGLGKTTLLRMISNGSLKIPSYISILHVEQEVVGDDKTALESVLECDTVRQTLLDREKEIEKLLNSGSAELELSNELAEVYASLSAIEADKAPTKASIILIGLGFSEQMQLQKTKTFSGGWRMRLALARALFSLPDLLLLDEPTNMLDMKAIIWLENYLQSWPTTLLVVSHDRHFLDTVPTDILHIHSAILDPYRGNYTKFDTVKCERTRNRIKEIEAQEQHKAHVKEFIDRFRYNANRASSVQSKIKMLEKLPELKPVEKEIQVVFKFPDVDPLSPPILQLKELSFGYSPDKLILKNVEVGATLESRICVVGDNGAGKTTLLKLILGILTPTQGMRIAHRNLKFAYFSQHHVDQLEMNCCAVELLQQAYPGKPIEEYRRHLGCFGVSGDLALQVIASLSGGQKSRVAFAKMCITNPNFLILDEPTNHLDIETIEGLGMAIEQYMGGVILVSHDERLIRMVCKELWVCSNGTVTSLEGGFDEYRGIIEKELSNLGK